MELGRASGWYFFLLPPRLPGGEESCRGRGRGRGEGKGEGGGGGEGEGRGRVPLFPYASYTHTISLALTFASSISTQYSHMFSHLHILTPSQHHNITHSQGEAQAQGRSVFLSCSAFYDRICQPLPYSHPLTWEGGPTW